jgi:hypothetical protein
MSQEKNPSWRSFSFDEKKTKAAIPRRTPNGVFDYHPMAREPIGGSASTRIWPQINRLAVSAAQAPLAKLGRLVWSSAASPRL